MANKVVTVLEADGVTQTDIVSLDVGRQGIAASKSVALSTEDFAVLDGIEGLLTTLDGRVDGLETLITSTNTKLDTLNTSVSGATIDTGTPGSPATTEVMTVQGAASMTPVASVGKTVVFALTPTLDTSAYGTGDVLFDRTICNGIFRVVDGTGVLQSIQVIDQDDNGVAIDFYIHTTDATLGTANSTPSISDANAVELLGPFSIATGDYKDLGGVKVGKISNIGQPIKAVSGTDDLYISAVVTGTPTFTAAGIKLRIGVLQD
jgi:hypothetical protein